MIVIPMAGASSRFIKAGYPVKKYRLMAHGHSMFAWSVASFSEQFDSERFVFICAPDDGVEAFVESECRQLGIRHVDIRVLREPTRGQAETVYLGLQGLSSAPTDDLTIFNIDTIRSDIRIPTSLMPMNGYIETFQGEGSGWSFVVPGPDHTVLKTTEKIRVSDECSTGLYYFSSIPTFMSLYDELMTGDGFEAQWGERYICPMYNRMIEQGQIVKFGQINHDEIAFAGTPAEYEEFKSRELKPGHVPKLRAP